MSVMGTRNMRALAVAAAVALGAGAVGSPADAAKRKPTRKAASGLAIKVLSNRADLVSDGQALVEVRVPKGVATSTIRITLGDRDVTSAFATRAGKRFQGMVTGLALGKNVLTATAKDKKTKLVVTNHANGGPAFSGPQLQPWSCPSGALDKQCNRPARFSYLYRSTDVTKAGLQPYDPGAPPSDVATTTTDEGVTVPFVVRQELGYKNRDQYKVLTLFDPSKPWDRWAPQRSWNHKVLIPGGGGCGGAYGAGEAPLADFSGTIPAIPGRADSYIDALGRGFAVMSTALANTGHNCNVATEAEALIALKEHVIERYGDVRYTIGTGCSGGSIVQHTVANAYPRAVYDGLIVTCAYPDTFTAGAQFADSHLMRRYFENPSRWGQGVVWSPHQWGLVEGHATHLNAVVADEGLFKGAITPIGTCAGEQSYHPQTNPGGVRCSVLDYMINVLGPRPQSVWSEQEHAVGRGFAGIPFSNAGIQYGLGTLRAGLITPDQFVDLNEKIGGFDIDAQPVPQRLAGDDASIANAYRSGLVNEADHLEGVAIIDHAGPDPAIAHDFSHTWWMRDRLTRAQGHHDNHVLWVGSVPLVGDPSWPTEALIAMDRWMAAVEADRSRKSRARKIRDNRPDDVRDRCQYVPGVRIAALDGACLPDIAHTRFGTSREVAGGDRLNDILKCRLRPIDRGDYGPLGLSDAQWERLRAVFPSGVCDWRQPGVGQQPAIAWQTYQEPDGRVVYGGRPMPRPPVSGR